MAHGWLLTRRVKGVVNGKQKSCTTTGNQENTGKAVGTPLLFLPAEGHWEIKSEG